MVASDLVNLENQGIQQINDMMSVVAEGYPLKSILLPQKPSRSIVKQSFQQNWTTKDET